MIFPLTEGANMFVTILQSLPPAIYLFIFIPLAVAILIYVLKLVLK